MKPRKLTDIQESELLAKTNQRKLLSERNLCVEYKCSRATLRAAVKRAQARQNAQV